ncbi:hypothetical protein [Streptomyces rhizosphaericus]|uniref:hypothetical protein n=1 Tax=Streptomyces rhizosphaericus TaxID=114699 RepID=UPI00202DF032|nr:hypothetical protein [Streptomyces rhizosphaericus]
MAGQVPADALEAFRVEQAGLDGVGVPDAVLGAGSVMPDARLLDVRGETVTLKQARGG